MTGDKNMMRLLLLGYLFMATGCGTGVMLVTKHSDLVDKDLRKNIRVVSIEPDVNLTKGFGSDAEMELSKSYLKEAELTKLIKEAGEACQFEMEVVDHNQADLDADYFNNLAPLKQEMMLAFFTQFDKLKDSKTSGSGRLGIKQETELLDWGAELQQLYTGLPEKYGTPYFSFQGIYRVSKSLFFINIICDLEMGEVVFSDLRMLSNQPSASNLYPLVYDSFNLFKKAG